MPELEFMQFMWNGWEKRWGEVKCLECGAVLHFHPHFCAHILSKGAFPQFRTDMRNIIPLCADHHQQFDHGKGQLTRKDMKVWNVVEPIIKELKLES